MSRRTQTPLVRGAGSRPAFGARDRTLSQAPSRSPSEYRESGRSMPRVPESVGLEPVAHDVLVDIMNDRWRGSPSVRRERLARSWSSIENADDRWGMTGLFALSFANLARVDSAVFSPSAPIPALLLRRLDNVVMAPRQGMWRFDEALDQTYVRAQIDARAPRFLVTPADDLRTEAFFTRRGMLALTPGVLPGWLIVDMKPLLP